MKVSKGNNFKKSYQKFRSFLIFGSCLGFAIWQTIQCMTKYIQRPQGTTISMKKSANVSFPTISICGSLERKNLVENDLGLNETYLKDVCGIYYFDYDYGTWANINCSDPKELYEAIVLKPEDIIKTIKIWYWTKSNVSEYSSINEFKDWYYRDYKTSGRCVILAPSHEHSQHGIKQIYVELRVNSTIVINTPGMLSKGSKMMMYKSYVELGKHYTMNIDYNIYELLDYGGEPCNNDKSYQLDDCNSNGAKKKSMEMIGCTSPYALNKTKICTDATKARKAADIYTEFMDYSNDLVDVKNYEGCYYPCSYFVVSGKNSRTMKMGETYKYAEVYLKFEQLIKETKSYYAYSGLSLIAEIGGYVGLFLGISINQLTVLWDILDVLLEKFYFNFKS